MAAFAQGRVGQPLQREQGALDPAECPQRARQRVARTRRGQFAQDHRRDGRASLDRPFEARQLGPLRDDRRDVDGIADHWLEQRIRAGLFDCVQLAVLETLDPRAVQDVRRFALGGSDDLDPVWPVSSRDVGVEHRAGIDPVFRAFTSRPPAVARAAGTKILSVGGGGCAVIRVCRLRMFVMRVDDRGARGDVVVVVDVPLRDVDQVMVGQAVRGVGHARQTPGSCRRPGRQRAAPASSAAGVACAQMGEAVGEPLSRHSPTSARTSVMRTRGNRLSSGARCSRRARLRRRRFGARDV